ncbi:hypothetical protein GCM10010176_048010 [Nonomuraea spiralis]|nr:hypothetical protein GCM10010176_048010 [Nonomuraea spiralis]
MKIIAVRATRQRRPPRWSAAGAERMPLAPDGAALIGARRIEPAADFVPHEFNRPGVDAPTAIDAGRAHWCGILERSRRSVSRRVAKSARQCRPAPFRAGPEWKWFVRDGTAREYGPGIPRPSLAGEGASDPEGAAGAARRHA